MIIFIIVFLYAVTKFIDLEAKNNPNVSFFVKEGHFDGEEINLTERGFRIAYAVEGLYPPQALKDDPAYVKWIFRVRTKTDGAPTVSKQISHHKCTDADYEQFYPTAEISKLELQ